MTGDDEVWIDEAAGQLVRPYTVNGGRTHPTVDLDMLSLLITVGSADPEMGPEHLRVLGLCPTPISVAEVAAKMRLPLMVTKVLIADLVEYGAVATRTQQPLSKIPDRDLLEKLLDGLQRI